MVARLLALYGKPTNTAEFDKHYREVHIPLAKKLPNVRKYTVSKGVAAAEGESPYYFIAEVDWDNMASLQAALSGPEAQAAVADLPNFATGGITILLYEFEEV